MPRDFLMVSMSFLMSKPLICAVPADGGNSPVKIELQEEIVGTVVLLT